LGPGCLVCYRERVVMEVDMDMEEEDYPDTKEDSFRTLVIDE
jgi:hypothetical protein